VIDLTRCRLYGIIDLGYINASRAVRTAKAMIEGGVDLIQLRGKERPINALFDLAARLHEVTSAASVPLIVNDHAEIARKVPVEGVHLGQDDDSIVVAREKAGRDMVVGKSTHSLVQARAAAHEGADYIGFGPLYATPTKPDYQPIGLGDIAQVHADVTVPIFCIGGIKLENLPDVLAAGARRVVIVSGLLQASDIVKYAREAKRALARIKPQTSPLKHS